MSLHYCMVMYVTCPDTNGQMYYGSYSRRYVSTFSALCQNLSLKEGDGVDLTEDSACLKATSSSCFHCCR